MKRKEQLKRQKLEKKYNKDISTNPELETVLKIFIWLLIITGISYFIVATVRGEINLFGKNNDTIKDNSNQIQYEEIIAGETFNKTDADYMIVYLSFTSDVATTMLAAVDSYKAKTDAVPIYIVDMDKGFNKNYVSTDVNNVVYGEIENLKIVTPSIIRIKDKKVTVNETGYAKITEILK